LAIVYLDNGFGKEVLADAQKAMAAAGIKATAEVALATDGKNMAQVVEQTLAAKPAAVFLATAFPWSITKPRPMWPESIWTWASWVRVGVSSVICLA
jgi:branched-chain amino acid transport system substrate-binding protein